MKYIEKLNDKSLTLGNIRFFCMGKELKEEMFIYNYDIADEMTIQAMIRK